MPDISFAIEGKEPDLSVSNVPSLEELQAENEMQPAISDKITDVDSTIKHVMDRFESYKRWREYNVEGTWDAIYRGYKGMKPIQPSPYKAAYVIREIFRQVETLCPQLMRQLLGDHKYIAQQDGFEEQAGGATAVTLYQVGRYGYEDSFRKWIRNTVIYGNGYLTYGWNKYKKSQRKITAMHAEYKKTWWERETTEQIEEAPYLEHVRCWEVYTHPLVEDIQRSPAVYIRKVVSAADLKSLIREGYLDRDAAKEIKGFTGAMMTLDETYPQDGPRPDNTLESDSENMEMLVCWTSDGWEYVVLQGKFLLRAAPLAQGRIPLIGLTNYPQAGEHYGMGEPLIIMDDQRILNDFMGMYVDTVHYTLNPMWKVARRAKNDWKFSTFKPGGAVVLDNPDDVQPLAVNPTAMNLESAGQFLLHNMKLATGLSDELAGAGSNQKTATGLVRLQDAAGVRIEDKVRLFMPGLKEAYRQLYDLNAEHLQKEIEVRIEGEQGQAVFQRYGPEVFEPDIDVSIELPNMSESGPEMVNKWLTLYKMAGQDPMVDRQMILERLFRAMGEKRPKRLLSGSASPQLDALEENKQVLATGILPDPKASDDHATHGQIHQMFMSTPEFMMLAQQNPVWAGQLKNHLAIHGYYMQQMQKQNEQAQQTQMMQQNQGAPVPEANSRAENIFDNSATGAQEQGMMPNNATPTA